MVNEKNWKEFRDSGLLTFINQFLHIFGWSIVLELNEKSEIVRVYPARVKFRGFNEKINSQAYVKLSKFMVANASDLLEEAKD